MKEWIYYIRIENSLAHYVPCEGPEDTRKKDTSIVEKVRDDCLLKTMADSRRCCYRKGLSDSSEDKKKYPSIIKAKWLWLTVSSKVTTIFQNEHQGQSGTQRQEALETILKTLCIF